MSGVTPLKARVIGSQFGDTPPSRVKESWIFSQCSPPRGAFRNRKSVLQKVTVVSIVTLFLATYISTSKST